MNTKETLIKALIVRENEDILRQKYLNVYDGTGEMEPRGNAKMELDLKGEMYYVPFVGNLFKAKFPELDNINVNGQITDRETIEKIKANIF